MCEKLGWGRAIPAVNKKVEVCEERPVECWYSRNSQNVAMQQDFYFHIILKMRFCVLSGILLFILTIDYYRYESLSIPGLQNSTFPILWNVRGNATWRLARSWRWNHWGAYGMAVSFFRILFLQVPYQRILQARCQMDNCPEAHNERWPLWSGNDWKFDLKFELSGVSSRILHGGGVGLFLA